jgi:hypothetical protein
MTGASLSQKIDMDGLSVGNSLFMRQGAKFTEAILRGMHVKGQLGMHDASFTGRVDMEGLQVGGHLLMEESKFSEVVLRGAHINGQLNMTKSSFAGDVDLSNTSIEGIVIMETPLFLQKLKMQNLRAMANLFMGKKLVFTQSEQPQPYISCIPVPFTMHGNAQFTEADLRGAHIGGQLIMIAPIFRGKLEMDHVRIGSSLYMVGGEYADVKLGGLHTEGQL